MLSGKRLFRFASATALLALVACDGGGAAPAPGNTGPSTSIAAIQGDAASSAFVGRVATISGIVTGDFQDNDNDTNSNLGGFFVQSSTPDAIAATSDGIFVFDGDDPQTAVDIGDRVAVTGEVQEFFGETQIVATSVKVTGRGTVEPVDVVLPAANTVANSDGLQVADLEAYEGMLLRLPQTLTVTDLRNLERFGEVRLAEGGRLMQFTNANSPSVSAYASHRNGVAARSIVLDDGQRAQNVATIRYLNNAAGEALRGGDTVSEVVGNLRYSRGSGGNGTQTWRLMPTSDPVFENNNPRPLTPSVGGDLRIASFNAQNLFSGIDDGNASCGPLAKDACRGADNIEEFVRQLAKTTTALAMMDADIVGLVEVENNASDSLQAVVDALNTRLGSSTFAFVNTGSIGDDAIRTGFIYNTTTVATRGAFAVLGNDTDARFNDDKNRPVLAQTFRQLSNDAVLTIAVAHLKSKGSDCDAERDPNTRDGQGNCNRTRSNAAAALADWLQTDPTASGDPDVLIIGDLNAYLEEDPVAALRSDGFVDLLDGDEQRYSFVFDGQWGALDHALVSPSLRPQVAEIVEWHINADESPIHDYNLEHNRDTAIFDAKTPYRASDHDPLIVGIDLN